MSKPTDINYLHDLDESTLKNAYTKLAGLQGDELSAELKRIGGPVFLQIHLVFELGIEVPKDIKEDYVAAVGKWFKDPEKEVLPDQPALAQLMFCLSHNEKIPQGVKKKALEQWGQYLLARGEKSAEAAFFGSGNYAKRQWIHQRRVTIYKQLEVAILKHKAVRKADSKIPFKTQTQLLMELMPAYMHGDGPGALDPATVLDGFRRWRRKKAQHHGGTE